MAPTDAASKRRDTLAALTKILPGQPVTDPREFNRIIQDLDASGLCNLICPTRYIDHVPQYQAVSFRLVFLGDDDIYEPRGFGQIEVNGQKVQGYAPKGDAVMKLARESAVQILPSQRLDDRTDAHIRHYRGNVVMRGMHGRDIPTSKEREIDLRPGAAEFEKMKDNQKREARVSIDRVCETKAQLRAIRAALGLKQAYTAAELARPFVITILVANLDASNPVHANLAAAHALGVTDKLYGQRPQLAAAPEAEPAPIHVQGQVIDISPGTVRDPAPFDPADYDDDEEQTAFACTCPCGCGQEVSPEAAAMTRKKRGAVRCPTCWPGKHFDYEAHKSLSSLALTPDTTPDEIRKAQQSRAS